MIAIFCSKLQTKFLFSKLILLLFTNHITIKMKKHHHTKKDHKNDANTKSWTVFHQLTIFRCVQFPSTVSQTHHVDVLYRRFSQRVSNILNFVC